MKIVQFIPPSQRRLVMLAAQADTAPVLLYGAAGTGKGGIAKWIHDNGPRVTLPFLTATRDLSLSDQLPKAQGGTLFIPEIGEWPLGEQKILLQFLETKSLQHPENTGMKMLLNVRIMADTNQSLEGRAQGGLFNIALLKKLNVFRIEMPTLCKRLDEFDDIVMGLMHEMAHDLHKEHLRNLSQEAWDRLKSYEWPGNLRELRNVLRLAVLAARGDMIESADLPEFGHDKIDFRATREEFEKTYIIEILKTFDWQIDTTCKMTHMEKNTLLSKMQKYGITAPQVSIP